MMAPDPDLYPQTRMVFDEVADHLPHPEAETILETLGEYEHGRADVEDVGPAGDNVSIRQYAAVALDLALVFINKGAGP